MAPPPLDEKKIIHFFNKEFNYDVGPIFQPTQKPDVYWVAYNMYKFICQSVFQLNENFFATDPEEITAGALPMLRVATALNSLLNDLQGDPANSVDFSVTDIIMPNAKKTKIFLSWLIPYYEVIRERKDYVEDLFNEIDQRRIDLQKDEFEVSMMEKQVENKRRLIEQMKRQKNEMFEKAGRLEEEIHHKKAQIAEMKGVHAKQEEQLKSFVELLKQEHATLKAEKEENSNLEKNIVQSPERLLKEIETLKEAIDEVSGKLVETEKSIRDMQRRKSELAHLMENCTALLEELARKCESKWEHFNKELHKGNTDLNELEEMNGKSIEAKKRVEQARRKQHEELQKNAHEKQQLEDEFEQKREQKAAIENEIRTEQEREKALKEENKKHQSKHKEMQEKYKEIDTKFNEAIRNYMKKSKEIKQKISEEEKIIKSTSDKMQKAIEAYKNIKSLGSIMHDQNINEVKNNENKPPNN
uniref:Kinetochore protein Nuf2 N-terminal domain-containing protein n=1 Tax=Acrobeloides nanus TaxID=290746 RepID=A0A914D271_9BILA